MRAISRARQGIYYLNTRYFVKWQDEKYTKSYKIENDVNKLKNIFREVIKMVSLEELLGVALKIEGSGYEFYTKLASRSTGKNKDIFKSLADQEREHMKIFKEIISKSKAGSGSEPLNEEAVGYLKIFAETSIFPEIEQEVPADMKSALQIALDVEKDSVIFYEELLKYAPQKDTIQKIADEERRHFKDILKMIETSNA